MSARRQGTDYRPLRNPRRRRRIPVELVEWALILLILVACVYLGAGGPAWPR